MTVEHIIFDLDGTLVDSAVHCGAILSEMLEERGSARRVTRADAIPHMSYGGKHLVTALLDRDCGDPEEELARFRERYAARPTPETCLYKGARASLKLLTERGYVLGVCSNKPQPLCDKIVDELDLRPMLTSVVGSMPDLPPKPDRAMLDRALDEMGAPVASSLLVGDSEVDHALASAAGMSFWLVSHGYPGADWTPTADAIFDGLEGLAAALPASSARMRASG